ncbi:MAG TPA: alanine racemase [Opitutales bacterium]|nr:alanine racemase [Opitutales bacterium]
MLNNLAIIKKAAPRSRIMAMVKGNAYGHGIRSVAQRLEPHVDVLGVATWDEALVLKKIGIKVPILLMRGATEANQMIVASKEGIQLVFHNETQLTWLDTLELPAPIHAWLKIDTGMGRLGFSLQDAERAYQRLSQHRQVSKPLRLLSHLACADDLHDPLNEQQKTAFQHLMHRFDAEFSLCNSAGIFNFPECRYDFVRPGLALYGASPLLNTPASALGLKPVLTLKTQLIAIKKVIKGHSIGYGSTFICPEDMTVGMVAIGYGDGYPRNARQGTPVLIHNIPCPLIGRVSMDLLAVDLRTCADASIGDNAVLWGDGLPIETIATFAQQSPYDLLAGIQNRVKFIWE